MILPFFAVALDNITYKAVVGGKMSHLHYSDRKERIVHYISSSQTAFLVEGGGTTNCPLHLKNVVRT